MEVKYATPNDQLNQPSELTIQNDQSSIIHRSVNYSLKLQRVGEGVTETSNDYQ
jgi:hypothetical protein